MYNTPSTKVTKFFDPVRKGMQVAKANVIEAASDAISAPARLAEKATRKQTGKDAAALKEARAYDDAPSFDATGNPTPALKARTMADEVRTRLTKK